MQQVDTTSVPSYDAGLELARQAGFLPYDDFVPTSHHFKSHLSSSSQNLNPRASNPFIEFSASRLGVSQQQQQQQQQQLDVGSLGEQQTRFVGGGVSSGVSGLKSTSNIRGSDASVFDLGVLGLLRDSGRQSSSNSLTAHAAPFFPTNLTATTQHQQYQNQHQHLHQQQQQHRAQELQQKSNHQSAFWFEK
jgi:hypothetical protein